MRLVRPGVLAPVLTLATFLASGCDAPEPGQPEQPLAPEFGVEPPPPPPPDEQLDGRMTGGGSVFTEPEDMRVTHGFQLRCDDSDPRQNLQINWRPTDKGSSRWHLETLTFAACSDDPSFEPNPPEAPIDTYHGKGMGRYNGEAGATAEWIFTDQGEPGVKDRIVMLIVRDPAGNVVLEVDDKSLTYGNHQAHRSTGGGSG